MKINTASIGKFGGYENTELTIQDGFTLFLGNNESGKTTLRNFFSQILFGFAKKSAKHELQYQSADGSKPFGSITFTLGNQKQYRLDRQDKKINVILPNQSHLQTEPSGSLWNGIDKETFRQIFCMDIQDWNGLSLMDEEAMQNRFLSASFGLNSLTETMKKLRQSMDELWKPSGRSQEMVSARKNWQDTKKMILAQEQVAYKYSEWGQELQTIETKIRLLEEEKRELSTQFQQLQLWDSMKEDWISLHEVELQFHDIPYPFSSESFSPTAYEQALECDKEKRSLEEEYSRQGILLQQLSTAYDKMSISEKILENKLLILQLVEQKNQFIDALEDFPKIQNYVEIEQKKLQELLHRINPSWNEKNFQKELITLQEESDIHTMKKESLQIEQDVATLSRMIQKGYESKKSKELKKANLLVQTTEIKSNLLPQPDLVSMNNQLERMQEFKTRLSIVEQEIWKRKSFPTLLPKKSPWMWVVGILLLVSSILVVGRLAIPSFFRYGAYLIGLIGFAFLLPGMGLQKNEPVSNPKNDLLQEIQKYCTEHSFPIQSIHPSELEKQILSFREKLADQTHLKDSLYRHQQTLEEWGGEEINLRHEIQQEEEQKKSKTLQQETLQTKWVQWKKKHAIDEDFPLSDCDILLSSLREAYEKSQSLQKERDRSEKINQYIRSVRNQIQTIYSLIESDPVPAVLSPDLISHFQRRLDQTLEEKRTAEDLQQKIIEKQQQLEETEQLLRAKSKKLTTYFSDTQTESLLQLETKTNFFQTYQNLSTKKNQYLNRLYGKIGNEEKWNKTKDQLAQMDFQENEATLESCREKIKHLDHEVNQANIYKGELQEKRDNADKSTTLGTLIQHREFLEETLLESAQAWISNALSLKIIQDTKAIFEKKQQPGVIKFASEWIHSLTDGQYYLMKTGESEKSEESFVLYDDKGNRKTEKEWSGGLADQVYLSIRMGLVNELSRHGETLPILLDDILIRFDPIRQKKTAKLLLEMSSHHQILYFSCHPHIQSLFQNEIKGKKKNQVSIYYLDDFTFSPISKEVSNEDKVAQLFAA